MNEVLEILTPSRNGSATPYVIKSGKSRVVLSSGIEVQITPVPMQILLDIREEFRDSEPKPPLEPVPGADDPNALIPNYASPEYELAVREWQFKIGTATADAAIRLGTVATTLDLEAVKRIRDYYAKYRKTQLDEDDNYVFIKYVACETEQDQVDLLTAVTRRSQPTEGAVATVLEQFPAIS